MNVRGRLLRMIGGALPLALCCCESSYLPLLEEGEPHGFLSVDWTMEEDCLDGMKAYVVSTACGGGGEEAEACEGVDSDGTQVEAFACGDGLVTTRALPLEDYKVRVEIREGGTTMGFTDYKTARLDIDGALVAVEFEKSLKLDKQAAEFSWSLVDRSDNQLSCADEGAAKLEVVATRVKDRSATPIRPEPLDCSDLEGKIDGLVLGEYRFELRLLDESGMPVNTSEYLRQETIHSRDKALDLGHFEFTFETPEPTPGDQQGS